MPTRYLQADGSIRFEDEQGKATLLRARSGVVLITYSGYLKTDFFAPLIQEMDNELQLAGIQKKLLVVIADCWDLKVSIPSSVSYGSAGSGAMAIGSPPS